MKRFRSGEELELKNLNLAQVLMLMSQNRQNNTNNMFKLFEEPKPSYQSNSSNNNNNSFKIFEHPSQFHLSNRQFECKTCNRQFQSFQALGGHRASHKKSRIMTQQCIDQTSQVGPTKPKVHECPICGLEFNIGQALGGHMRRHRAIGEEFETMIEEKIQKKEKEEEGEREELCLDLNLAPPGTEWRKIGVNEGSLHKVANMVDCFL